MIRVVVGRLADQAVGALLRPIRSDLAPVSGPSRDVAIAAGPELGERLSRIGVVPLGGAVLTPAGGLEADFVIHVVVTSADEPQSVQSVQRALRNGLRRAADWGVESVALPPLGLGAGAIDAETAARALMDVLFEHVDAGLAPLALTVVAGSEYEAELLGQLVDEWSSQRERS